MVTFILVHGTFAKSARWPILQNSLAETARSAGHEPAFEWLSWTGRNRAKARQTAASEIFTLVQRVQRTSANERIFIIGHSHGGSVIGYFLKEHPEAAKTLAGCAFLSTPFVAIRPRKEAVGLIAVLLSFPFFTFISIWNETMNPRANLPDYLGQTLVYLFGVVIALVISSLIWFFFKKANAPERVKPSIRQQTADIPAGNYLFLRYSGDEAAAALSAAQFIAWLGIKISTILKLLTQPLFNEGKIGSVSWFVLFVVLLPTIAYGLLQALPDFIKFVIHYPDSSFFGYINPAFIAYKVSSLIIVSLLLVCLLAVFLIVITQAVTSWAFGWTRLSTGFLVELAIEPLPFGEHSLVHIDWAADSIGLDGYVHSWTYAHPDAIKHLQNWVRTSLGN
jgi:pimeloyl-ACP methyl ester carboxylesterase